MKATKYALFLIGITQASSALASDAQADAASILNVRARMMTAILDSIVQSARTAGAAIREGHQNACGQLAGLEQHRADLEVHINEFSRLASTMSQRSCGPELAELLQELQRQNNLARDEFKQHSVIRTACPGQAGSVHSQLLRLDRITGTARVDFVGRQTSCEREQPGSILGQNPVESLRERMNRQFPQSEQPAQPRS